MAFFFIGEYSGFAAMIEQRNITTRGMTLFMEEAHRDVAKFWHSIVLPRHFKKDAKRQYHYKQRKKPYSSIKQKLAQGEDVWVDGQLLDENVIEGGLVDIIRGGDTRSRTKSGMTVVKVGRVGVTVKVRVPRYVSRRRRGDFPDLARELKRLTFVDRVGMTDIMQSSFVRNVKAQGHLFVRKRIGRRAAA